MAALHIINCNLPTGLIMKLSNCNQNSNHSNDNSNVFPKNFNKITIQNVLSENGNNSMPINTSVSNPHAIVRQIKDFGMIGTVNKASDTIISRTLNVTKNLLNEPTFNKNTKLTADNKTETAKKPRLTKEERTALRIAKKSAKENSVALPKVRSKLINNLVTATVTKLPGTPGRKGLPLPLAVARRNARERNRVKQVNNGFAALRERIPDEVAEAYESQNNGRNTGKKLSKVETLRMAVEYIRGLERLLGFEFPIENEGNRSSSSGEDSFLLVKDEFDPSSPTMEEQFDDSLSLYDTEDYYDSSNIIPTSGNEDIDSNRPTVNVLPSITTLNGLQYMRIPGTNTYQLLTLSPDLFITETNSPQSSTLTDDEHLNVLIEANCLSPTDIIVPITEGAAELHTSSSPIATKQSIPIAPADTIGITSTTSLSASVNDQCINRGTSPSKLNNLELSTLPVPCTHSILSSTAISRVTTTTTTSSTITTTTRRREIMDTLSLQSSLSPSSSLPISSLSILSSSSILNTNVDSSTLQRLTATTTKLTGQTTTLTTKTAKILSIDTLPAELSPATDEQSFVLRQKCADEQHRHYHHEQQKQFMQLSPTFNIQMIKQEYDEVASLIVTDHGLNRNNQQILFQPQNVQLDHHNQNPHHHHHHHNHQQPNHHHHNLHQQQQQINEQQLYIEQIPLAISPEHLEHQSTTVSNSSNNLITKTNNMFSTFYETESNTESFFEGMVTLKKEFHDVLLNTNPPNIISQSNVLNDESMIGTIDWWETSTDKIENNTVIL